MARDGLPAPLPGGTLTSAAMFRPISFRAGRRRTTSRAGPTLISLRQSGLARYTRQPPSETGADPAETVVGDTGIEPVTSSV